VGINTFAKIPCTVAQFLKLDQPQLYTGHSLRRSSASILSDSGAEFAAIKRLGGWKSTSVAEAYIEDSIQNKVNIAKQLFCTNETASSSKAPGDINCNEVT
jgi:integrase